MKNGIIFLYLSVLVIGCKHDETVPVADSWTNLLDKDLSNWDKFIGVPHYSITSLPDHPKGDGMNGTPLGLDNDPLQVFKAEEVNGEVVLHISGEIYGGLSTKTEYENYHFSAEFKWGEKKYEPRLTAVKDNGLLYHCYGQHGAFWNVWMLSQEMQVQEADMGDYFALGPAADVRAVDTFADNQQAWMYNPLKPLIYFGDGAVSGRCRRNKNAERSHGEWNTLELVCLGGKSMHIVNGQVVMVLESSRVRHGSSFVPLQKGKIQIQSEGAEAWYRKIRIRPITEIPEQYQN